MAAKSSPDTGRIAEELDVLATGMSGTRAARLVALAAELRGEKEPDPTPQQQREAERAAAAEAERKAGEKAASS